MAEFDLKTSSRKTISASGSIPSVRRCVAPLAEGGDVDRAEDLVRLGEARQQVLEVLRLEEARERADQRALRRPGRADEDGVLAGDRRDEKQADDLVLAEKPPLEQTSDLRQPVAQRARGGVVVIFSRGGRCGRGRCGRCGRRKHA